MNFARNGEKTPEKGERFEVGKLQIGKIARSSMLTVKNGFQLQGCTCDRRHILEAYRGYAKKIFGKTRK